MEDNLDKADFQRQLEFEELVATVSARFVSLNSNELDRGVQMALRAVGNFLQADRCAVFLLSDAPPSFSNTHEWCAAGVESLRESMPTVPADNLPLFMSRLRQFKVVAIADSSRMPAAAHREQQLLRQRQTRALLAVPMIAGDAPTGLLVLEAVSQPKQWPAATVPLLKIVSDLFVSAFDRNRAEAALRQSEERFRRVITSISDHIYFWMVTDKNEHINLYLSPNIEELTGYPYEQFATDWAFWNRRVIHPDDQPAAARQAAKLASGQDSQMEYRLVRANGEIIWVRDSGRVEQVDRSMMVYGVVADVTERKKAEEALAEERALLAERVAERTSELSLANAELSRAARLKDEFLAAMSHELRTPLNTVLGMAEALQEQVYGALNQEQNVALTRIEESGRHLLSLINDILDLSRIEAGKMELQMGQVDIFAVCQASLYFIDKAAKAKQLDVALSIKDNIILYADQRRLKQVLINLLSNAVKFTPEGGKIGLTVTADPEQPAAKFTVWDTGIGIAKTDMDVLFKPFVQLDSRLARQYEGTGLGLALVYKIVEIHQGSVAVESQLGQGSRFTVYLPLHSELAHPELQPESAKKETAKKRSSAPARLILLAEDNEANIATLSEYLSAAGYRLVVARDGAEAIERVKESQPDLVLMDVQMPVMDGLEATRQLRADSRFRDLPIITLTALAMPGDRERCLAAGANEYISKPVSLKHLVNTIESLLK